MTPEKPDQKRQRSPYTVAHDTVLVRFDMELFPGDTHFPGRERLGRPARSPSLPPEDEPPPAATDTPPPTN